MAALWELSLPTGASSRSCPPAAEPFTRYLGGWLWHGCHFCQYSGPERSPRICSSPLVGITRRVTSRKLMKEQLPEGEHMKQNRGWVVAELLCVFCVGLAYGGSNGKKIKFNGLITGR